MIQVTRRRPAATTAAVVVIAVVMILVPTPTWAQTAAQTAPASRAIDQEPVVRVVADPAGASARVTASIDIGVPSERIWRVMLDCQRATRFVAGLKSCRVVNRGADGAWDVREHVIQWLWPLPAIRSEFRSDYVTHRSIRFRRTSGDLKVLEGNWTLEPLARAGTRLKYEARIDPGFAVPNALVRQAVQSDLPRTLKAIRDEATRSE
jgi:ribosome-associated toxin RatA of RatAB toxin-antitoxin module